MPITNPSISAPRIHPLPASAAEEWLPVTIDPRCLVSDRGRVLGVRGRLLGQKLDACGYPIVGITGFHPFRVHRLVALAFLGEPPEGCTDVDHLDCDKTNNDVRNLQWTTRRENVRRAWDAGLMNPKRGEECHLAKLDEDDVRAIKRMLADGVRQQDVADAFGVTQPAISYIARGINWAHVE